MKSRSIIRDEIVKTLYQVYIYKKEKMTYDIDDIIKENSFDISIKDYILFILKKEKDYENIANSYLNNWTVDRLSLVDKAIINLAIYEILDSQTPDIVAINEAIELSKKYSDEKVVGMINGLLDKIYHGKENNEY